MKTNTTNNEMKELKIAFSLVDEKAQKFIDSVSDKTYTLIASESNSIFSLVDERKNTVVIAYDNFRLQFTTVNAKRYKEFLFADNAKYKDRFYTHLYKQKEFISIKTESIKDLKEVLTYIKSVDREYKKSLKTESTKVVETTASEVKKEA